MLKHIDTILKFVDKEFESIENNGKFRSREEIDSVYKLMDIAKDIYCIYEYEEDMSENGSYERGYGNGRDMYSDGRYEGYERRGRGRNASRDSRGRYNEGIPYYDDGMMRRGSYSYRDGGKEEFVENLHKMMNEAPDEQTRKSIQKMLDQM